MRDVTTQGLPETTDTGEVIASREATEFGHTPDGLAYTVEQHDGPTFSSSVAPEALRVVERQDARDRLRELGATTEDSLQEVIHPVASERQTSPEELPLVVTIGQDLRYLVRQVRASKLFDPTPQSEPRYLETDQLAPPTNERGELN